MREAIVYLVIWIVLTTVFAPQITDFLVWVSTLGGSL